MIKHSIIALLTLLPLPALAEGYLVTPKVGGGIKVISITSVTDWVLAEGYGNFTKAETDKATSIIFEEGKPPRVAFDTLEVLDKRYGGDGSVDLSGQTIHLEDSNGNLSKPKVISLDDIPEGVPIKLFEDDIKNYITLRDGLWRSSITSQSQKGCPPQIAPMVKKMVGKGATTKVKFSTPYHPTDFSDQLGLAVWRRVSANGFVSKPFSPIGGQAMPQGMKFSVQYGMVAVSPERFNVWSRVTLKLPAMMATMMGGSSTCVAEGRGHYTYSGK